MKISAIRKSYALDHGRRASCSENQSCDIHGTLEANVWPVFGLETQSECKGGATGLKPFERVIVGFVDLWRGDQVERVCFDDPVLGKTPNNTGWLLPH